MKEYDIAIVGGGGAGLTAAVYAARARRSTVVFERLVTGGQIATTDIVENFPGFPEGVNGFDLAQLMLKQAEKFGAEMVYEGVESLERTEDSRFRLETASGAWDRMRSTRPLKSRCPGATFSLAATAAPRAANRPAKPAATDSL